jgi:hypothetical protein
MSRLIHGFSYLIRVPGALHIRVQFPDELRETARPRLAQTTVIQEEVDPEVGLGHLGLIVNGEAANALEQDY